MRVGNWYSIMVCANCAKRIGFWEETNSDGVCKHCGSKGIADVIETHQVILRATKHHPIWRFWNKEITYEGRDEFSKNWLEY